MSASIPQWPANCTNVASCYNGCLHVDGSWTENLTELMPEVSSTHTDCVKDSATTLRSRFGTSWGGTLPEYQVTFRDTDGTTTIKSQSVAKGADATPPNVLPEVGYEFSWSGGSYRNIQSPVTLTLVKTPVTVFVNLHYYTGETPHVESQAITYPGAVTYPADYSRTGYTFTGWNPNKTSHFTESTEINAEYTANVVTVTFNYYVGTEQRTTTKTVTYPNGVQFPTVYQRTGYDFTGWQPTQTDRFVSDTTITAQYQIQRKTVTFNYRTNNESAASSQQVDYGSSATAPSGYDANTGYTFASWDKPLTNITEDTTITASYTPKQVWVYFFFYRGSAYQQESYHVTYPNAVVYPTDCQRTGYEFTGWDKNQTDRFTEDTVIHAEYTPKTVAVTFRYWDQATGSTVDRTQLVTYPNSATFPTESQYQKPGYDLVEWEPAQTSAFAEDTLIVARYVDSNILSFVGADSVTLLKEGNPDPIELETSVDCGKTWSDYTVGTTIVPNGQYHSVHFRAKSQNSTFSQGTSDYYHFSIAGDYHFVRGSVLSLLKSDSSFTSTLPHHCFYKLFYGCTGLATTSNLILKMPSTALSESCYESMFEGCTTMSIAPVLPATTSATRCYAAMFKGCTALTESPVLNAATVGSYCYDEMFRDCTSLNRIETRQMSFDGCSNWVRNVSGSGSFMCRPGLTVDRGWSGVPLGWDVGVQDFLNFTAAEAGSTVQLDRIGSNAPNPVLYTSTDGETWSESPYVIGSVITLTNVGDKVFFKAGPNGHVGLAFDGNNYCHFYLTGRVSASGNIQSLLDDECIRMTVGLNCYHSLFSNNSALTTAPSLPATTLGQSCYNSMFLGCTSLTTAPMLPATTMAQSCYESMFSGSTSLTAAPALPATTLANMCYESMFSGCTSVTTAPALNATTMALSCYERMFLGCTSLTAATALPATTLRVSCYESMFSGCTALTTAPTLPAATLAQWCYYAMFEGCTALTTAPALPATTLATQCYVQMFDGCSSLNYVSTRMQSFDKGYDTSGWLAGVSDSGVFVCSAGLSIDSRGDNTVPVGWTVLRRDCLCFTANESQSSVKLQKVGSAPSVTLYTSTDGETWSESPYVIGSVITLTNVGDKVFFRAGPNGNQKISSSSSNYHKFVLTGSVSASGDIQSLLDAAIERDDVPSFCYYKLFVDCSSLTSAPRLIPTDLDTSCYNSMFLGCTALTTAPELPATTLAESCYYAMFEGCTSLTEPPTLPATTLAQSCYQRMFLGCSGLGLAPELSVTTLQSSCYASMFEGCVALTMTPILPAETLVSNCYQRMFYGCTNLNYVITDQTSFTGCASWLSGVMAEGTFACQNGLSVSSRGVNTVPSGWTVRSKGFLNFTAAEAGSTVRLDRIGSNAPNPVLYTSTDGVTWSESPYVIGSVITLTNVGDKVFFKAGPNGNQTFGQNEDNYCNFVLSGRVAANGSVQSLLSGTVAIYTTGAYCFYRLFYGCGSLTTEPVMDARHLGNYCYQGMYEGCSNLTEVYGIPVDCIEYNSCSDMYSGCTELTKTPYLHARTIKPYGCAQMFEGCVNLTSVKPLLASVSMGGYYCMFKGCTSLTTAPALPSTVLSVSCYEYMFRDCTSLTTAPTLSATTLRKSCYYAMFRGCTSLTTAPALPATTLAESCYYSMFLGCTSLTTAPTLSATTLAESCYYSMFLGCTSLTTAPALPATTLAQSCYESMFSGCTSLTTAPALPATTLAQSCYESMFFGCTSLTTAQTISATTLANASCAYMFNGCTSLASITVNFTTWYNGAFERWMGNVASSGTFNCSLDLPSTRGVSNIPNNWTIQNYDAVTVTFNYKRNNVDVVVPIKIKTGSNAPLPDGYNDNPDFMFASWDKPLTNITADTTITASYTDCALEFVAMDSSSVKLQKVGSPNAISLQVSRDHGLSWSNYTIGQTIQLTEAGQLVSFRATGTNARFSSGFYDHYQFVIVTGHVKSRGSVMSLLSKTGEQGLVENCFYSLFENCAGLVSVPRLPAMTLANYCYACMFRYSGIERAPELPAETLTRSCYYEMFVDCKSMTTAPGIKALQLGAYSCSRMFLGCSSLSSVTVSMTAWSTATSATGIWLSGVAGTGTFTCPSSLGTNDTITRGPSNCPEGWTVVNT